VNEADGRTVPRRAGALVVASVGVLFVLLAGGWLIGTKVHLAGTNSVAPRYGLAGLTPGHRICMKGLVLPGSANGIGLQLAAPPGRPAPVTLTVNAGGRTQVAHSVAPGNGTFGGTFSFAAIGRTVPASACLTAARPLVQESGMLGSAAGTGAAFLDGHPIGMLSVRYLRPGRSLLSAIPSGARHASLFRAGFVGAWTYWLMAAVVLLLWALGLRLVLRGAR
jgi:hypothetical protein